MSTAIMTPLEITGTPVARIEPAGPALKVTVVAGE